MTVSAMLSRLLPACVAAVEAFGDRDDLDLLLDEERAVVARAVDKRRREFATVRACARQALGRIGVPPAPILPGERGAPTWPTGVVGSMTHCDGYRAAAVASNRDVLTIGIDAEPHARLPDGVLEAIALGSELAAVRRLGDQRPDVGWDRLLFSAKESVYKAWFPLTSAWLDFGEAEIEFDPAGRRFTARLLVPRQPVGASLTGFTGRWLHRRDLLISAIVVPRA